jgi:hypothetical protein
VATFALNGEKMTYLFNFLIAVFVWLGLFNIELVSPLINQPLSTVLSMLTAGDYLLLVVTFIAVSGVLQMFDRIMEQRKRRSAR